MEKVFFFAVIILGVVAISAIFGLLFAFPVMWLWNWLMPEIFRLPAITYWQAYGLFLFCAILFKSSGSSSSSK